MSDAWDSLGDVFGGDPGPGAAWTDQWDTAPAEDTGGGAFDSLFDGAGGDAIYDAGESAFTDSPGSEWTESYETPDWLYGG